MNFQVTWLSNDRTKTIRLGIFESRQDAYEAIPDSLAELMKTPADKQWIDNGVFVVA